jgi:hypothetical protein
MAVANLAGVFQVVFVGDKMPTHPEFKQWHSKHLLIRKWHVLRMLQWLKDNNHLYQNITIDMDALAGYSDDGSLPVEIFNQAVHLSAQSAIARETGTYVSEQRQRLSTIASMDEKHRTCLGLNLAEPVQESRSATAMDLSIDDKGDDAKKVPPAVANTQSNGMDDRIKSLQQAWADVADWDVPFTSSAFVNSNVNAQDVHNAGVEKLLAAGAVPDQPNRMSTLWWPHGPTPISEFDQEHFLELAYPTLYPRGRGGFDFRYNQDGERTKLSFAAYIKHCLKLADPRFRQHFSWMFVVYNLLQRHTVLRQASARAKTTSFIESADQISKLSSEMVSNYYIADSEMHCRYVMLCFNCTIALLAHYRLHPRFAHSSNNWRWLAASSAAAMKPKRKCVVRSSAWCPSLVLQVSSLRSILATCTIRSWSCLLGKRFVSVSTTRTTLMCQRAHAGPPWLLAIQWRALDSFTQLSLHF